MKNKKNHKVSPTFIIMILAFIGLLSYFCYNLATQIGFIPNKNEGNIIKSLDTNQLMLNQKDSIISIKDKEIDNLKKKLANKPDTVYIKPRSITKRLDTISVSKFDSIK